MVNLITSGDSAVETDGDDWVTVLVVTGHEVVNHLTIINEGDFAGYWCLSQGEEHSQIARLPAGAGPSGERRASITFPCPGFSGGTLRVRRGLLGGNLSGIFAFATG